MPKGKKTKRDGDYTRYKSAGTNAWRVAQSVKDAQNGKFSETLVPSATKCSASMLQLDHAPNDAALAEAVAEASMDKSVVPDEQGILLESGMDMAGNVANDEDLESCGKGVERLSQLGKGSSIASSGKDPTFPASMESIASKEAKCGDSAAKVQENCAKFNHWMTLTEIKKQAASGIRVIRVGPSSKTVTCEKQPKDTTCKLSAETKGKYEVNPSGGYVCINTDPYGKSWTEDLKLVCSNPNATPPATQPPATQPPATQPPATQPPATQPPATQPPATQPPATQPPTPAPTPLTYFRFRNKKDWSKNCLDLDVHSKNIIVWECHDGDNQKWAWDGGRLRSKENSNLCVTMGGRNGESVKASECGGSADQAIKQGKDETMKTSTECTVDGEVKRCCLDWDWDDPHEVLAWGCHGRVNQKWVQAK